MGSNGEGRITMGVDAAPARHPDSGVSAELLATSDRRDGQAQIGVKPEPERFESTSDLRFHRLHGDPEGPGDLLIGKILLPTHREDETAPLRKFAHRAR